LQLVVQRKTGHIEYLRGVRTQQQTCAGIVQRLDQLTADADGFAAERGSEAALVLQLLPGTHPLLHGCRRHVLHFRPLA
jgi:hypothetical protein